MRLISLTLLRHLGQTGGLKLLPLLGLVLLLPLASAAQVFQVIGNRALRITTNPLSVVVISSTNIPATETTGLVRLRNGDSLQGKLLSIDPQKLVRWENPNIHPAIEMPAAQISKIRLAPLPRAHPPGGCVLGLLGGDQFTGNLVSLDNKKVVLRTWYAGELTFPRNRVRWIRSNQASGSVYHGPTGLDGWVISASAELADEKAPAWGYSRGIFFARKAGGIARDVKLPDRAAIDLDLVWKQFLQLTITIYTDSLQVYRLPGYFGAGLIVGAGGVIINNPIVANPVPANAQAPQQPGAGFYAIHLNQTGFNNQTGAHLMTVRKSGEINNSGIESIPGLEQKTKAHVSLRIDKPRKTISLLVDGKLIKTWEEVGEFAGQGTAIRFVQQGYAPINIKNISVAAWDGFLDDSPDAVRGTNDFVQLKNQDFFSATLQHVRNGAVALQTAFGPMRVPMERVVEIDLAGDQSAIAPLPEPGSVRAWFTDTDGSAWLQIERWDERKVVATSPAFGRAEFNPAAFSQLEFK